MANIFDTLINAAKKAAQDKGNQILQSLRKTPVVQPTPKPAVKAQPVVSPYAPLKAPQPKVSPYFTPNTSLGKSTPEISARNEVSYQDSLKLKPIPGTIGSLSQAAYEDIRAADKKSQDSFTAKFQSAKSDQERNKAVRDSLSVSSLPGRIFGTAPAKLAAVAGEFLTPVSEAGRRVSDMAYKPDSAQNNPVARALAAANLTYEGAKAYGAVAPGASSALKAISKPATVSAFANVLPEDQQSSFRPALEAYSVLKSPEKLVAGLNVLAGRATDPISNYVNNPTNKFSSVTKDAVNLGLNLLENVAAVKGGKFIGAKAAPSVAGAKAGYEAYKEGKPLENVLDQALKTRDTFNKKPFTSSVPASAAVLGFKSPEQEVVRAKEKNIVPQDFNTEKLNVSADQATKLDEVRKSLGMSEREVRSFEKMREMAAAYDADTDNLLKRNKNISDAEVIALRDLVSQNSDYIAKNEGRVFTSSSDNAIHQQKLEAAQVQINQALRKLVKGGTEAGRTVVAFKQLANKSMEPTFWYLKAQKMLGEKNLTPEMQAQINKLTSENDRIGVAMYVANLHQPSFAEKATTLWKAGLLTSPTTHIANVTGNAVMGATNLVSKGVSTGLDKLASLVTGKRTTTVSPLAALKGTGKGILEAGKFLKTGIDADQALNKYDLPRGSVFKGDTLPSKILKGYSEGVFRSLGAEDKIFRTASTAESLRSQAKITALNEGLKGDAYKKRVDELVKNPSEEMALQALADAEYATFNNKNVVATMVSRAKAAGYGSDSLAGRAAAAGFDVVTPFVKTPTNVAARLIDFSPLGLIKTFAGQVNPKTRGQKRLVEDLGRTITGSGILALGIALGQNGMMTGAIPENEKERDQFYAEGKQPNSININGNWYQLNRIAPIGNLLAIGAQISDLSKEKDGFDLVASSVASGVKNVTDQTFLQGLSGGLQVLTDPEANAGKFFAQTASSVVPTIVARLAKAVDPTMRNPKGFWDTLQSKVPGLSQNVSARLDVFGNEVQQPSGIQALVDPFSTRKGNKEPVLKEARKVGVVLGLPSDRMYNDKLSPQEYVEYQKMQGGVLKDVLSSMIESPEYQNLSSTEKSTVFEKAVSGVRDETKAVMYPSVIINRYQLPQDTNPEILLEVMNTLNKEDLFLQMSEGDRKGVLDDIMNAVR